jgi:hypothetical protein
MAIRLTLKRPDAPTSETIFASIGYVHLTNTRSLALIGASIGDGLRDLVFIFLSGTEEKILGSHPIKRRARK